jgi:hypothetical protein
VGIFRSFPLRYDSGVVFASKDFNASSQTLITSFNFSGIADSNGVRWFSCFNNFRGLTTIFYSVVTAIFDCELAVVGLAVSPS